MRFKKYLLEKAIVVDTSWVKPAFEKYLKRFKKRFKFDTQEDIQESVEMFYKDINKMFPPEKRIKFVFKGTGNSFGGLKGGSFGNDDYIFLNFDPIELAYNLHHNIRVDEILEQMESTIYHELVHKSQLNRVKKSTLSAKMDIFFRSKQNTDGDDLKDYFSDKREIMAYASQAARDLLVSRASKEFIKNMLKKPTSFGSQMFIGAWSPVILEYISYFKPKDKEYKRFFKYVYQALEQLS